MSIKTLQAQLTKLQARLNDLHARQAALDSTRALTQSQITESENALSHSRVSALVAGSDIALADHDTLEQNIIALRVNLDRTAADLRDTQAAIARVSADRDVVTQEIERETGERMLALATERLEAAREAALKALVEVSVLQCIAVGDRNAIRADSEVAAHNLTKWDTGRVRETRIRGALITELRELAQGGDL